MVILMIVLFTDFGVRGPYVGQMKAVLQRSVPQVNLIDLFSDAPRFNPLASSYLLAAYVDEFPKETVFLCVVDPGVGSGQREPVVAEIDGRWFVGPDNGLFDVVALRAESAKKHKIVWRPEKLSDSFHGRDIFAPAAARLANGELSEAWLTQQESFNLNNCKTDLDQVIYIDDFGNAMTGRRAATVSKTNTIKINGATLLWAKTFSEVPEGSPFWYQNANGLVEFAVNCGHAAEQLELKIGDEFAVT